MTYILHELGQVIGWLNLLYPYRFFSPASFSYWERYVKSPAIIMYLSSSYALYCLLLALCKSVYYTSLINFVCRYVMLIFISGTVFVLKCTVWFSWLTLAWCVFIFSDGHTAKTYFVHCDNRHYSVRGFGKFIHCCTWWDSYPQPGIKTGHTIRGGVRGPPPGPWLGFHTPSAGRPPATAERSHVADEGPDCCNKAWRPCSAATKARCSQANS